MHLPHSDARSELATSRPYGTHHNHATRIRLIFIANDTLLYSTVTLAGEHQLARGHNQASRSASVILTHSPPCKSHQTWSRCNDQEHSQGHRA